MKYFTNAEIIEIRKELRFTKLSAIKLALEIAKNKGVSRDSFDLKVAKEYVETLLPWKDPVDELRAIFEDIQKLKRQLPLAIEMVYPGIQKEKIEKALNDEEYLKKLVFTSTSAQKFGL